jgi:hypothetical protein
MDSSSLLATDEKNAIGLLPDSPTDQLSEDEAVVGAMNPNPVNKPDEERGIRDVIDNVDAIERTQVENGLSEVDDDEGYSEGDEDEDDDDGDEDEEEEEEPALKYERLGGAVPELLQKDAASALAISENLIARLFTFFCMLSTALQLRVIRRLERTGASYTLWTSLGKESSHSNLIWRLS